MSQLSIGIPIDQMAGAFTNFARWFTSNESRLPIDPLACP